MRNDEAQRRPVDVSLPGPSSGGLSGASRRAILGQKGLGRLVHPQGRVPPGGGRPGRRPARICRGNRLRLPGRASSPEAPAAAQRQAHHRLGLCRGLRPRRPPEQHLFNGVAPQLRPAAGLPGSRPGRLVHPERSERENHPRATGLFSRTGAAFNPPAQSPLKESTTTERKYFPLRKGDYPEFGTYILMC